MNSRKHILMAAVIALMVHATLASAMIWSEQRQKTVQPVQPIEVSLAVPPKPVAPAVHPHPKPVAKQIPVPEEPPLPLPAVDPTPQTEEPPAPEEVQSTPVAQEVVTAIEPPPISPPLYQAAYLNNPIPAYPLTAKRMGVQGTVILRVWVSPSGLPLRVDLSRSSGSSVLDQSALKAVRGWTFIPARQGNDPITATVEVPIHFHLTS